MAKYILGSGVTRFKGSRGSSVFQKCGTTFSIRMRRKPRFQRTQKTSQSRNVFHHVQSNWRVVSPANQNSWDTQAPNFPRVNSLGQNYELLPLQLFSSQNKVLSDSGIGIVDVASPPVTFPNPSLSSLLFTASPGNAIVTTSPLNVPSDFIFRYFVSNPIAESSMKLSSLDYLLIFEVDEGLNSNTNWFPAWKDRFGIEPSSIGRSVAFRMDIVSKLTGQRVVQFNQFSVIG